MTSRAIVVHVVAHVVRSQQTLVAAWIGLVTLQPLLGLLIGRGALGASGDLVGGVLLLARLVLGLVVAAALLHADEATSTTAFWKSRPVPPIAMAASRVGMVALLLFLLPALVTFAGAAWLALPAGEWPRMLAEVWRVDGLIVGVAALAGSRTRTLPTMTLVMLGVLLACLAAAVLIAEGSVALSNAWLFPLRRPHVDEALGTIAPIVAGAAWSLAALTWFRRAGHRASTALVAVTAVLVLTVLLLPVRRAESPSPRSGSTPRVSVDAVDAKVTPAGGWHYLSVAVDVDGLPPDALGHVGFTEGWLATGAEEVPIDYLPTGLDGHRRVRVSIARLGRASYEALRGHTVRLRGRVEVEAQALSGRRLRLIRDNAIQRPGLHVRVVRGPHDGHLARLEATWSQRRVAGFSYGQTELWFTATDGSSTRAIVSPQYARWSTDSALLPTIATPFGRRHIVVDPPRDVSPAVRDGVVTLEVRSRDQRLWADTRVDVPLRVP